MADEEKGSSSWFRVPTWDGNPREWRSFKREMDWWIASLDRDACKEFNVAARWILRQRGVVRARCEEFDPSEVEGKPEVKSEDPQSGEMVVVEEAEPFSGLQKLMTSLESLVQQSLAGKVTLDLSSITLPQEELGWFLRERLGLDPLRKQLLETASRERIIRSGGIGMCSLFS